MVASFREMRDRQERTLSVQIRREPPCRPIQRTITRHPVPAVPLEVLREKYRRGLSKTKWFPGIITSLDRERGRTIVEQYAPVDRTKIRVTDFIEVFMSVNGITSMEEAATDLLGQFINAGVTAGTAKNYLRYAADMFGGTGPIFRRVLTAVTLMHSESDSKTAVDRTILECKRLIDKLRKNSPYFAAICELIFKTGLRFSDIRRLKRTSIVLTDSEIKIEVRRAKNRRNRNDRVITRIPTWFGKVSVSTEEILNGTDMFPFSELQISTVLRAIQTIDSEVTTYSFRRRFFHEALLSCRFDFDECARKYSLHRQTKTLRAYYDSLHI